MSKTYLTATNLAARWHLTPHTLSQWRWNGRGPRFSKMGKKVLYELKHIEEFEEKAVYQNTSYIPSLDLQSFDIPLYEEELI